MHFVCRGKTEKIGTDLGRGKLLGIAAVVCLPWSQSLSLWVATEVRHWNQVISHSCYIEFAGKDWKIFSLPMERCLPKKNKAKTNKLIKNKNNAYHLYFRYIKMQYSTPLGDTWLSSTWFTSHVNHTSKAKHPKRLNIFRPLSFRFVFTDIYWLF